MEQIQLFNYENHEVRTIDKDGQIWFTAKDLEPITGHKNINQSLRMLDNDELMITQLADRTVIKPQN